MRYVLSLTSPLNPLSINGEGTFKNLRASVCSSSPCVERGPGGEVNWSIYIHALQPGKHFTQSWAKSVPLQA